MLILSKVRLIKGEKVPAGIFLLEFQPSVEAGIKFLQLKMKERGVQWSRINFGRSTNIISKKEALESVMCDVVKYD